VSAASEDRPRWPALTIAFGSAVVLGLLGPVVMRAILGDPPPPGPPIDFVAPGEPESPGLGPATPAAEAPGADPRSGPRGGPGRGPDERRSADGPGPEAPGGDGADSWEAEYFPVVPYEAEPRPVTLAELRFGPAPTVPPGPAAMIRIPAGSTRIGDDALAGSRPARPFAMPAFEIDETEVTCHAYQAFLVAKGLEGPWVPDEWGAAYRWTGTTYPPGAASHPVVLVTHAEAEAYCAHLGKRLPTEAEWERAARGDASLRYPWGPEWDSLRTNVVSRRAGALRDASDFDRFAAAFTAAPGTLETRPVGTVAGDVSPFGVRDLAGNVSEWVAGTFGPYPGAPPKDRKGFGRGLRVARGNAWGNRDYSSPVANRYPHEPEHRDVLIGFRCAR
jgi:formylglycine-generating enzyme required for sulfatase activity